MNYKWAVLENWAEYCPVGFNPNIIRDENPIVGFIYDVDGGLFYDYQWNKVKLDYIPEKLYSYTELRSNGMLCIPYHYPSLRACFYKGKRSLYFPDINKILELDIEVDPCDLIFNRDFFRMNGKTYRYIYERFISETDEIFTDYENITYEGIISFKRIRQDRLFKLGRIYEYAKVHMDKI